MTHKAALRLIWLKKRSLISPERRTAASRALAKMPLPEGVIGSFASFRDELSTHFLNLVLAQTKSLALPRLENGHLMFYQVEDLSAQLTPSPLGFLEPLPSRCPQIKQLGAVLVPGLAFDKHHYRLGYGKGHYDQYLAKNAILSIGIGFKEQLTEILPHDPHDIPLQNLFLF